MPEQSVRGKTYAHGSMVRRGFIHQCTCFMNKLCSIFSHKTKQTAHFRRNVAGWWKAIHSYIDFRIALIWHLFLQVVNFWRLVGIQPRRVQLVIFRAYSMPMSMNFVPLIGRGCRRTCVRW